MGGGGGDGGGGGGGGHEAYCNAGGDPHLVDRIRAAAQHSPAPQQRRIHVGPHDSGGANRSAVLAQGEGGWAELGLHYTVSMELVRGGFQMILFWAQPKAVSSPAYMYSCMVPVPPAACLQPRWWPRPLLCSALLRFALFSVGDAPSAVTASAGL